jgi:hypothetical protein
MLGGFRSDEVRLYGRNARESLYNTAPFEDFPGTDPVDQGELGKALKALCVGRVHEDFK